MNAFSLSSIWNPDAKDEEYMIIAWNPNNRLDMVETFPFVCGWKQTIPKIKKKHVVYPK